MNWEIVGMHSSKAERKTDFVLKIRSYFRVHWDLFLGILVFTFLSYFNAWLCDDSFISFRVVDNFVNGFGLRWNIDERVQVFTNPLLVLIVSSIYYFTQHIVWVSLGTSYAFGITNIYLLWVLSKTKTSFLIAILFLFSSRAFFDYSYSGLENPLNYAILTAFFVIYFSEKISKARMPVMLFLMSLAFISRYDFILIFILPFGLYLFSERRRAEREKLITWDLLVAALPAAIWLIFSAIYYGSIFPNTYYAKTYILEPQSLTYKQGLSYLVNELRWDAIGLCFLPFLWIFKKAQRKQFPLALLFMLFSLPYIIYTVRVGGDFMGGRFFSYPILLAGVVIARIADWGKIEKFIIFALLALYIFFTPGVPMKVYKVIRETPLYSHRDVQSDGITDERAFYYSKLALANYGKENNILINANYKINMYPTDPSYFGSSVTVGLRGFLLPREYFLLDLVALTDPLTSRLKGFGRIGHKMRLIPKGYIQSLMEKKNLIESKGLKEYYEGIRNLTRNDIWTKGRLLDFWDYQFGKKRRFKGIYQIDFKATEKIHNFTPEEYEYIQLQIGKDI